MVQQKQHLTIEGILKLVSIKATLNWGLSEKFKESYPHASQGKGSYPCN